MFDRQHNFTIQYLIQKEAFAEVLAESAGSTQSNLTWTGNLHGSSTV
jgi:hypothetical protein